MKRPMVEEAWTWIDEAIEERFVKKSERFEAKRIDGRGK